MPLIKLHMSADIHISDPKLLITEIREAIVQVLGIPENIGQVILYDTPRDYRCIHEGRNIDFVFVEIIMYPGRSTQIKKALMERITALVQKHTGVERPDINCFINEISADNWFSGTSHRYIEGLS